MIATAAPSSPRARKLSASASCTPAKRGSHSPSICMVGDRLEVDHAADAVLRLHQLEAAVDLLEAQRVRQERVDVDVACHVALHELRYLCAPLYSAEGGPA